MGNVSKKVVSVDSWVSNIASSEGSDADKVLAIFRKITKHGIKNYGSASVADFINKRNASCQSLVDVMYSCLRSAGVDTSTFRPSNWDDAANYRLGPSALTIAGLTGNTGGVLGWFFPNHHWATWGGTEYDLLFNLVGTHAQSTEPSASGTHNGVDYKKYGSLYAVAKKWGQNGNCWPYKGPEQAHVTNSEKEIQDWIDHNKK